MMGGQKSKPKKTILSKAAQKAIEEMQQSPHIRFILTQEKMEQAIANEEIRRKVLARMERTPLGSERLEMPFPVRPKWDILI